jgi:hypothetical protein
VYYKGLTVCREESNQFVQVFVGPHIDPNDDPDVDPERKQHRFQLLKCHVWDRPYFRNTISARNYFLPIGDNAWELQHPHLTDIHPDDFKLIAEYLTDNDFGHRHPQGEEQVSETFAHCMSAWRTAELLGMDDLLDHIVEKMEATTEDWNMYNVMAFACNLYQPCDYPLDAHDKIKGLLTGYIAEYFFIYIDADDLRAEFLDRLKQSPEFKHDVLIKVAGQPNHQQRAAEVDGADEDMDLYS